MKEILLSDWTLAAFRQREEERRRKEQREAAFAAPQEGMQRGNETLRSDWTIAALQKRFAALEQRIAALEQREEEQRRKERAEATRVPPQQQGQRREDIVVSSSAPVAPKQMEEEQPTKEPAQSAAAKIEHRQAEVAGRANEQRPQRDRLEIRPVRNDETVHVGAAHKMARGFISFLITAVIAGVIGFGAGIYVVPIEKATHFRALVKRGLEPIYGDHSFQERQ